MQDARKEQESKPGGGQKGLKERVIDAGICSGCGACAGLCPYQDFYRDRSVVLHPCDLDRGRCYDVCPQTPTDLEALRRRLYDEADCTPEIGPLKGFFITRASDEGVRRNAQHGGTVSALVGLALREGLIDSAIVAEAGEERLLPRSVTVHGCQSSAPAGKSRFVATPTVAEFNRSCLGDVRRLGVVATPCQALALAKMRIQPASAAGSGIEKLGLVIGLFCGWILSWNKLVDLLKDRVDLDRVTGMDIPPSRYHTLEVYADGETLRIPLDDVDSCVRDSCRICSDMTAEFSDLSVGSARLPEGWKTARSWNQVIVRTQRGMELMDLARTNGILEFREVPPENLEKLKAASMGKKATAAKRLAGPGKGAVR